MDREAEEGALCAKGLASCQRAGTEGRRGTRDPGLKAGELGREPGGSGGSTRGLLAQIQFAELDAHKSRDPGLKAGVARVTSGGGIIFGVF